MTPRLCQHEHFMCGQVRVDALFLNTFKLPESSPAANIESMKLLTHLALSSKFITPNFLISAQVSALAISSSASRPASFLMVRDAWHSWL